MSAPLWTVELHTHTIYSKDCLTKLDRIQAICQQRGIDRLAQQLRNSLGGALFSKLGRKLSCKRFGGQLESLPALIDIPSAGELTGVLCSSIMRCVAADNSWRNKSQR